MVSANSSEKENIVKRIATFVLLAFMLVPTVDASAAPSLPAGIPKSAVKATVIQVKDGDKVYVLSGSDEKLSVQLSGVDAPEKGECYYAESKRYLKRLVPVDAVVYLEKSGSADEDERTTIRYVWLPGAQGKKASLVNTKMVRDGYAGFDDSHDSPKYFGRIEVAQSDAQSKNRGLWKACGELHVDADLVEAQTAAQEPTQTPVAAGWTAEEQAYLNWLAIQTVTLQGSMESFTTLTGNFQVTDLFDMNWIIQVAAVAATWQVAYDDAAAYVPPPAFAEVHSYWIDATAHLANAADYLTYGIDNLDAASIGPRRARDRHGHGGGRTSRRGARPRQTRARVVRAIAGLFRAPHRPRPADQVDRTVRRDRQHDPKLLPQRCLPFVVKC